jgi:23S rRNA pseudouridine1911/1915/1917 synthase
VLQRILQTGTVNYLTETCLLLETSAVQLPPLNILYEDNHLLAINKPVGLPTIGVADDEPSLAKAAKQYLAIKYQKPGNVYLGVMSRLDAVVSGVVLFARTSKAAARLSAQFRTRAVQKTYLAVVEGIVEPSTAVLENWLVKNERARRIETAPPNFPAAQIARLAYDRLAIDRQLSLLAINLETGRKHQIRVQLAARNHAIVGDQKYGSQRRFSAGIALHSAHLSVDHPTLQRRITVICPPPQSWNFPTFRQPLLRFLDDIGPGKNP